MKLLAAPKKDRMAHRLAHDTLGFDRVVYLTQDFVMCSVLRAICQHAFTVIGSKLTTTQLHIAQVLVNHLAIGRWNADHGFIFPHRVMDRKAVFDSVIERLYDKRVLYLEFGVYRGNATRYWAKELKHPESHFHGFDSFEGLPTAWADKEKGHFNTNGNVPQIDDPRVRFFKGLFHETLPSYHPPAHDALVIIMDADLYSSTIYVLRWLKPLIKPGTFIYFDELAYIEHEAMAFDEFMRESGLSFTPVCANYSLHRVFFECMASE